MTLQGAPTEQRFNPGPRPRWTHHVTVITLLLIPIAMLYSAGVSIRAIDQETHTSVPNLSISISVADKSSLESGRIYLPAALGERTATISAPGYRPATIPIPVIGERVIPLEPLSMTIEIRDADRGTPVINASIDSSVPLSETSDGAAIVKPARTTTILVSAPHYRDASVTLATPGTHTIALKRRPYGRILRSDTGEPVVSALIVSPTTEFRVDDQGRYELDDAAPGHIWVLAPGFERAELRPDATDAEIKLRPKSVRALYLAFFGVADDSIRGNVERQARESEANAIVIDVKGDRGYLSYASSVPLAGAIGANRSPTIPNVRELLDRLKGQGIYTIARIVTFKDDVLAQHGPEAGLDVGVKNRETGGLWLDGEGLAWTDPFRAEVRAYNVALASEAASLGFDEIQFDYIRFPTDPTPDSSVDLAVYEQVPTASSRVGAVSQLLQDATPAVHRQGALVSIDTFGYTTWNDGDMGIGQSLELLAPNADIICPMIYPSTFAAGIPGGLPFPGVVINPYQTIFESVKHARLKVAAHRTTIRPWLQYFDDYPWQTGKRYDAAEIRSQIRGAEDAGASGWMLWDPSNTFSRGGIAPRSR